LKKGLLLINLGTPDSASPKAVRRYLREFLADHRVITLPPLLRYLLLYGVILPFRTKQTTIAYQHVWTKNGSPLMSHSVNLQQKLQHRLADDTIVALGMRYGFPSIQTALNQLKSCSEVTVLPLYPQYSSAATGSSIERTLFLLSQQPSHPHLRVVRDFHEDCGFIAAMADQIKPYIHPNEANIDNAPDYLLFSYHGLPAHHLREAGCISPCQGPCPTALSETTCYRSKCFKTTHDIASLLGLNPTQYGTAFQSRLGRTPWIKPYTDEMLCSLAAQGIKRLAVVCPSFVADCLETLEEIGIRARAQWLELGGEQLTLIPCLNDSDRWVDAIIKILCYTK
jgi:ferrochelatase